MRVDGKDKGKALQAEDLRMMDPGKDITPGRMAQDQRGEGIGECPRVRRGAVMGDLIAITEECHHKGSRNNVLSLKTIEIFLLIFLLTIHPRIHHMVVDKECITEIEDEAAIQGAEDHGSKLLLVEAGVRETLIKITAIIVGALKDQRRTKEDGNREPRKTTLINNGMEPRVKRSPTPEWRLPNHQNLRHHSLQFTTPPSPLR